MRTYLSPNLFSKLKLYPINKLFPCIGRLQWKNIYNCTFSAEAQISTLDHEKSALLETSSESSKESAQMVGKIKTLESERSALEADLKVAKTNLESSEALAQQVEPLRVDLQEALRAKSEEESRAASLELDLQTNKESLSNLEKEKCALQSSLDEMRSMSSDSSAQIDKMNRDYEQLNVELSEVKSSLAESKAQVWPLTLFFLLAFCEKKL